MRKTILTCQPYLEIVSHSSHANHIVNELLILEHVYMTPEVTQTGLKSQTVLKCRSIYLAIYMEISLQQLSKQ